MPLENPPASQDGPLPRCAGVLLLGGAHGALALIRSFGRLGVPVALVTNDHPLPRLSRYLQKSFAWAGAKDANAAQWLVRLAEDEGMTDWLLIACGDAEVKLVASQHEVLGRTFKTFSCNWDRLKSLCDKQLLGIEASKLGIAAPRSYRVRSEAEARALGASYPLVLKPAMRLEHNAFTKAKAWRADNAAQLAMLFPKAAALVGPDNVMVQEFVPGGGEAQFSYAALWHRGRPVLEMTARRLRQFPVEFSFTSTFVEVVRNERVRDASRLLLESVGFEGLVEVEYKYDAREDGYKILDVNPRPWSWIALCEASGLQLASAMLALANGVKPAMTDAEPGHAWIHVTRDFVSSAQLMLRDELTVYDYLASLKRRLVFSTFAADDPWPGILDVPLTLYRVIARRHGTVLPRLEEKLRRAA